MSSSSSSSSLPETRRTVFGVPKRCWCGKGLDTWVSETKENPGRRFYRCKIALQRKSEVHLFKWVDEAILDEVRMVDAKRLDLLHDLQALSLKTTDDLESQRSWLACRDQELRNQISDNNLQMTRALDVVTIQLKDHMDAKIKSHLHSQFPINGHIHKLGVAVVVMGSLSYFYWKLI